MQGLADRVGDSTEYFLIVMLRKVLRPFCGERLGVTFSYDAVRDVAVAHVLFGPHDVPTYFHGIDRSTLRQITRRGLDEFGAGVGCAELVESIYQGALDHLDRATAPVA